MRRVATQSRRIGSQFTLIEMLGVITIIAVLAALLMPALARTRATARQVECLSRQRQIGIAMTLYVKKNDHVYPAHRNNSQTSGWFTLIYDEADGDSSIFACPSREVWACPGPHGFGTPHKVVLPRAEDSARQLAQHYIPFGYNGYWLGLSPYPDRANPMPRNFCRLTDLRNPSEVIVLADSDLKNAADHWAQSIWYPYRTRLNEGISDLHRGGANVLFTDGHVRWYDDQTINADPNYAGWWSPDPSRWR